MPFFLEKKIPGTLVCSFRAHRLSTRGNKLHTAVTVAASRARALLCKYEHIRVCVRVQAHTSSYEYVYAPSVCQYLAHFEHKNEFETKQAAHSSYSSCCSPASISVVRARAHTSICTSKSTYQVQSCTSTSTSTSTRALCVSLICCVKLHI